MQLRYDEDLIEAVVLLCVTGGQPNVPSLQIVRFHREREKLYRILDPDDRNAAFFRMHLTWFREWNLEKPLLDVLDHFPLLREKLSALAVRKSRGRNDEGAEMYINESSHPTAILALRPESFRNEPRLRSFVRHEFMHLHDMLDPLFGYSPVLDLPTLNATQLRLARERYRLLWDISIDGRLAARAHQPSRSKEQHAGEFDRAYPFWTAEQRTAHFERLWSHPGPRHADFLALINDPRGLLSNHRPEPGASCPLCGFPTFAWSDAGKLSPAVAAAIAAEFPRWTAAQGICGRCTEAYEAAVSLKQQAQASPAALPLTDADNVCYSAS